MSFEASLAIAVISVVLAQLLLNYLTFLRNARDRFIEGVANEQRLIEEISYTVRCKLSEIYFDGQRPTRTELEIQLFQSLRGQSNLTMLENELRLWDINIKSWSHKVRDARQNLLDVCLTAEPTSGEQGFDSSVLKVRCIIGCLGNQSRSLIYAIYQRFSLSYKICLGRSEFSKPAK